MEYKRPTHHLFARLGANEKADTNGAEGTAKIAALWPRKLIVENMV